MKEQICQHCHKEIKWGSDVIALRHGIIKICVGHTAIRKVKHIEYYHEKCHECCSKKKLTAEIVSEPEYGSTLYVKHNEKIILEVGDCMEPEDANFLRDLRWVPKIIMLAYELGKSDAKTGLNDRKSMR